MLAVAARRSRSALIQSRGVASVSAFGELPNFSTADPEALGKETRAERVAAGGGSTWDEVVAPMELAGDDVARPWAVLQHLQAVKNSPALRDVCSELQQELTQAMSSIAQNKALFEAYRRILAGEELPGPKRRALESKVKEAELAGVGLPEDQREAFTRLSMEEAGLAMQFQNNVLDSTREAGVLVHTPEDMEGIPKNILAQASAAARERGHPDATEGEGPWHLGVDSVVTQAVLEQCSSRYTREALYRARVTVASSGDHNNGPVFGEILRIRAEKARMLGFPHHAAVSLSTKMAGDVGAVEDMEKQLWERCRPAAEREMQEVADFAKQRGFPDDALQPWDAPFYVERAREARFSYSQDELKQYFPLPRVMEGLAALSKRVFGVDLVPAEDGQVDVWAEGVKFYEVRDASTGEAVAGFYLDPYLRPQEKRQGAWMAECWGRSEQVQVNGKPRLPVAFLTCNQAPPDSDGTPSLLTFRDVETLLHEFGHGLQHMLTTVGVADTAGINGIEWDAVELPSQMMEHWCYHKPSLRRLSQHVTTGEPIPDELFDKLQASRRFMAAAGMLRQLYIGGLDMRIHKMPVDAEEQSTDVGGRAHAIKRELVKTHTIIPPLSEDCFLHAFLHIFAGPYDAGYYSYKWAEVMAADAFGAFEEAGLDDDAAVRRVGDNFRATVLGRGGGEHPGEVFRAFRGREPSIEPLLQMYGLGAQ